MLCKLWACQCLFLLCAIQVMCFSFCVMHAVQSSGHVNVSFCCVLFKFCAFLSVMHAVQALGMSMSLSFVCYSSYVLFFLWVHAVQALSLSVCCVLYKLTVCLCVCLSASCYTSSLNASVPVCCILSYCAGSQRICAFVCFMLFKLSACVCVFVCVQTTEYVVLHTDLAADNVQNVEIVTDGNIDPDTILNTVAGADNSFVVVSEAGNHLHFIDSSTGLTVATMPASAEQLPAVTMMEGGEMGSQSVMMMEGEEVGSQSVTMIDGGDLGSQPVTMIEGGGVESQSVTMMGEEEVGAPAVTVHGEDATPVIISQAVADKGDNPSIMMSRLDAAGTITVHSDEGHLALQAEEEVINSDKVDSSLVEAASEVRETITVHTDSGPVQVMAGGEMADAIKQAMMVAEVVDSSAGTKL